MKKALILMSVVACSMFVARAQIGEEESKPCDQRVKTALNGAGVKYRVDADGDFRVSWTLNEGRDHMTIINSRTSRLDNMEMRDVWAYGYRGSSLTKDQLEKILMKNASYKTGSWSMIKRKDGSVDVIFTVVVSAKASGESLKTITGTVAKEGDRMEKLLIGSDKL